MTRQHISAGSVPRRKRRLALLPIIALAFSTSACTGLPTNLKHQVVVPGEAPIQLGTRPRDNLTPLEASLACFAGDLAATGRPPIVVGVGEVKDFTGRYSINEGNVVTQGGSLMLFSALGKMGGAVRIAERYDPSIAERELGYMDRRQLGDGQVHEANGQRVPWLPYFGGTVQASDYYIVGGITEVNYNLSSGGAELSLDNIGFKGRTYSQSVAIDLRIVDTRTLLVVDAISLSKQFVGYEVGANTFRFFGIGLVNVNLGQKGQEPLQLGIRATIEEAAMRLIGRAAGVNPSKCLALRGSEISPKSSEAIFAEQAARAKAVQSRARAVPPQPKPGQQRPGGPAAPVTNVNLLGERKPAPAAQPRAVPPQAAPVPAKAPASIPGKAPAAPQVNAATVKPARAPMAPPAQPVKAAPAPASAVAKPAPSAPVAAPVQRPPLQPAQPASTYRPAINDNQIGGQTAPRFVLIFELGSANLPASALVLLDTAAAAVRQGTPVNIVLLSPESEKFEPSQRSRLLDQRIASLTLALAARGVPAGVVSIEWRPTSTESTIYREGPGVQLLAKLRLMR